MTAKQLAGVISEKTPIRLGLVIAICGALIAGVSWATSLEARVKAHFAEDDKRVELLQEKMERTWEAFHSIDKRLGRIEDRMNIDRK